MTTTDVTFTKTVGDYTLSVSREEYPMNPRTSQDNLGTMLCFHNRYTLGDKQEYNQDDYMSWDELEMTIRRKENVGVILPLYLYDHGGLTIRTTPFNCPWDSGQVGFIYVTKEKIREGYGVKRILKPLLDRIESYLKIEVEEYDCYLRGEIYQWEITKNGEEVDSLCNYFGEESCISEGESHLEYHMKENED